MSETPASVVICTKCGGAFSCQPGPECWCAKLPHQEMAEDAEGCVCPDCLSHEIAKTSASNPS